MRLLSVLAAIVTCFTLVLPLKAYAVDYAMQLPGAQHSLLLDIAAAGERLVAVGERGHILVSDDAGVSWRQVEVPTTAMLTRVSFVDEDRGWAVGHDGNILHSHDGGLSWSLQRDGIAEQVPLNEARTGRALARVEALEAELAAAVETEQEDLELALEDARWALEQARDVMDAPVYAPPLMDVWFASDQQGWASGAYGTLLHTANGGRQWTDWSHKVDNPEELHLNGVVGDGRGTLYLASEWGAVFVSTSAGEAWEELATGYEGSFFGIIANPETGTVLPYGLLGTIYRSTDQGQTWQATDSGVSASLFGADYSDGALIFVGQGGTATVSHDDGASFQAMIQTRRDGLYGVVAAGAGRYVAAGQGGSRLLRANRQGGDS